MQLASVFQNNGYLTNPTLGVGRINLGVQFHRNAIAQCTNFRIAKVISKFLEACKLIMRNDRQYCAHREFRLVDGGGMGDGA